MTYARTCTTCNRWSNVQAAEATGTHCPHGASHANAIYRFRPPIAMTVAGILVSRSLNRMPTAARIIERTAKPRNPAVGMDELDRTITSFRRAA